MGAVQLVIKEFYMTFKFAVDFTPFLVSSRIWVIVLHVWVDENTFSGSEFFQIQLSGLERLKI